MDGNCADAVIDAYRLAKELDVVDGASPASLLSRRAPRIAALADNLSEKFLGRIHGGVGDIVERSSQLEQAVNQAAGETVDTLTVSLNRGLYGERTLTAPRKTTGAVETMQYVGPEKWADAANGVHRDLVWASTPREWWANVPPHLYDDLDELRALSLERKVMAEELGYPPSSFVENYARQQWEDVAEAQRFFGDQPTGTLIGPAKHRVLPNYAVGISAGLRPTSKTVGELMSDAVALWSRAVAEGFERKVVLGRYGTKGTKQSIASGKAGFRHPLYRGWNADREIVNAVEGYHALPGKVTRAALDVSAKAKNLAFGPLDIAVSGVQGLKALTTGGVQLFMNEILRGVTALKVGRAQHMRALIEGTDGLPKLVRYSNDGLHIGLGPSAVTTGKGTSFSYFGPIGRAIDKPLSAFIDGKARIEFGVVLTGIRVRLMEGNLLMLHMMGQDITDAAVRRTAANWANTMTGASRGAQTPGRRALETAATTSFQMGRSEIATLGGIVKAATFGSGAEKQMAMLTLASVGAAVYGLGSLINMSFGNGPIEFDPRNGKWATIQVGGKNVPIIPQRGLVRAIAKSITELEKLDEASGDKLARIWTQYVGAKLAPGTAAPAANLAGFGFDPDRGYEAGTLETKWRFLNVLPMPPVVSSAIAGERDPTSVGFNVAGFNPFPVSAYDRLRQAWKEEYPDAAEYEGGPQRTIAEDNPRLAPLLEAVDAEGRESGFEGALNREQLDAQAVQQAEQLRPFIEGVRAGNAEAGPQLLRQLSNYNTFMAGAVAQSVFGVDFDNPDTPAEHALEDLGNLNPYSDRFMDADPETGDFVPDWDAYDRERDRLIGIVDREHPGYRAAYEARLRLPEEFQDVEQMVNRAKAARDELGNISKYTIVTVDEWHQIQDLKAEVTRWVRERLDNNRPVPESVATRLRIVGDQMGLSYSVVNKAVYLNSTTNAKRVRSKDYIDYLVDHADELMPFYPSLYSQEIRRLVAIRRQQ